MLCEGEGVLCEGEGVLCEVTRPCSASGSGLTWDVPTGQWPESYAHFITSL